MNNLKDLLDKEIVKIAKLPMMNQISLDDLDRLDAYTVPLISHDYGAKTPIMWNSLYKHLGLNIRNIMVVGNPKDAKVILSTLKKDPKYLGGGAGVGFKEQIIPHLEEVFPKDLKSVNIVVNREGKLFGYNTDAAGFVKSLEDKFVEINKSLNGSNIIVVGAGGVSKEVVRLLAEKKAKKIAIINRTTSKAVELASQYKDVAYGIPDTMTRGVLLNSFDVPDAIINLTDKGSDGQLEQYSIFSHITNDVGVHLSLARSNVRELALYNPSIVIADIVLPKSGESVTLRIARGAKLENLLDGKPMVIYQAVPAYELIAKQYAQLHKQTPSSDKLLQIFKEAAYKN